MYQNAIEDIFDDIYTAVTTRFASADLATCYVNQPANFPHVQMWEESNTAGVRDMNLSGDECYSNLVIHFEVFDNMLDGVGADNVREIFSIIDPIMRRKGYRRTYYAPVANFSDASIYRQIARYSRKQPN